MKLKQTDKILIVGRSGCGKSYLGRKIAEAFPRLIIFDSLNEYEKSENDIYTFEQFTDVIKKIHNEKINKYKLIIKFDTSFEDSKEKFDHYIRILYELGNVIVVIEETQDYCTSYFIARWFKKAMTSGRHKNLGFIFTTQRPSFLNKTVLSQSTHIFVGNLIDKNDVTLVSNFMGANKENISHLNDREFLWFCPVRKPHTIKLKS
jgi:DNA helicase HerA-like ATPase